MNSIDMLLNIKAAPDMDNEQMFKRMFINLIHTFSGRDDTYSDLFMLESLESKQRERMENLANSLYRRLGQAFEPLDQTSYKLSKAFNLDRGSLDFATRIIVEHFFEDDIIDLDDLQREYSHIAAQDYGGEAYSVHMPETRKALRNIFPAYQSLEYLRVAGQVFDFPLSDTEGADIKAQQRKMIGRVIERLQNKPSAGHQNSPYANRRDPDMEI